MDQDIKSCVVNPEVVLNDEPIVRVSQEYMGTLRARARQNPRRRIRLCAHPSINDLLHEMLIVHEKGTYVRPHKHLNKTESVHIIEGLVDVVVFDDDGKITDVIQMGDYKSGRVFYYRMQYPYFHTLLIHSDILLFHEVTNGPFNRSDTVFAPWSPDENVPSLCSVFLHNLFDKVNQFRGISLKEDKAHVESI